MTRHRNHWTRVQDLPSASTSLAHTGTIRMPKPPWLSLALSFSLAPCSFMLYQKNLAPRFGDVPHMHASMMVLVDYHDQAHDVGSDGICGLHLHCNSGLWYRDFCTTISRTGVRKCFSCWCFFPSILLDFCKTHKFLF
jgi:hypothetical protein